MKNIHFLFAVCLFAAAGGLLGGCGSNTSTPPLEGPAVQGAAPGTSGATGAPAPSAAEQRRAKSGE